MFESIEELEKQVEEFEQNILASKALIRSIDGVNSSIQNQQKDFKQKADALLAELSAIKTSVKNAVDEINVNNNSLISDTVKELSGEISVFNRSADQYLEELKKTNETQLLNAIAGFSSIQESYVQRVDSFEQSTQQSVTAIAESSEDFKATTQSAVKEMEAANQTHLEIAVKSLTDAQNEHTTRIDSFEQSTRQSVDTIVKQSEAFKSTTQNAVDELKSSNKKQTDTFLEVQSQKQQEYLQHLETVKAEIDEMEKQLQKHYALFLEKLETTNISNIANEIQELKKSLNTKFAVIMGGIGVAIVLVVVTLLLR